MKDQRSRLEIAEEIWKDIQQVCDCSEEEIYIIGYLSGKVFSKAGLE